MSREHENLQFIELLLGANVLSFGEFVTKSGRLSPFFFNTGKIDSGRIISNVADFYANRILETFGSEVSNLFGPAYKGIPLCVAVSQKLASLYQKDVTFTYNRKEAKDHGEGGVFVGHHYSSGDKVVIVEDVLTGGTSIRETLKSFENVDVQVVGAIVGIDRQERGSNPDSERSARAEVEEDFGIPITSIVNLDNIVETLLNKEVAGKIWIDDELEKSINEYRSKYGA